ncbi:MAG: polyprenyl synthetase family protein, partial [Candidatus Sericytochromatia bacterium]|nr:polyprenyl synthetase family protein [Candidatus Tanganyikabacteria bacterium]
NDIRRRKRSLPAIHALEHSRGAAAQTLCAIYAKPSLRPADVARVLQAMDSVGTLAYCQALAKAHCQRALAHLRKARLRPDIQADFEELARFLLTRDR